MIRIYILIIETLLAFIMLFIYNYHVIISLKEQIIFMLKFIAVFGTWLKTLMMELANNIISVLLVLLLYFMLWEFPQTLDLLLVLNQNDATNVYQMFTMEVPLYFSLLLIIAFFIWNSPKYFYKANYTKVNFKIEDLIINSINILQNQKEENPG